MRCRNKDTLPKWLLLMVTMSMVIMFPNLFMIYLFFISTYSIIGQYTNHWEIKAGQWPDELLYHHFLRVCDNINYYNDSLQNTYHKRNYRNSFQPRHVHSSDGIYYNGTIPDRGIK